MSILCTAISAIHYALSHDRLPRRWATCASSTNCTADLHLQLPSSTVYILYKYSIDHYYAHSEQATEALGHLRKQHELHRQLAAAELTAAAASAAVAPLVAEAERARGAVRAVEAALAAARQQVEVAQVGARDGGACLPYVE